MRPMIEDWWLQAGADSGGESHQTVCVEKGPSVREGGAHITLATPEITRVSTPCCSALVSRGDRVGGKSLPPNAVTGMDCSVW